MSDIYKVKYMNTNQKLMYEFLSRLKSKNYNSYLIIKEFIKFLSKNNVLKSYLTNISLQSYYRLESSEKANIFSTLSIRNGAFFYMNEFQRNKYKGGELINYAFNWSRTDEGHDFWSDINNKWRTTFKNVIKKIGINE